MSTAQVLPGQATRSGTVGTSGIGSSVPASPPLAVRNVASGADELEQLRPLRARSVVEQRECEDHRPDRRGSLKHLPPLAGGGVALAQLAVGGGEPEALHAGARELLERELALDAPGQRGTAGEVGEQARGVGARVRRLGLAGVPERGDERREPGARPTESDGG